MLVVALHFTKFATQDHWRIACIGIILFVIMEKLCHHPGKLVTVRAIQFVSKGCVVVFEQNLLSLLGKGHFFPVIAYVDQFIGN